MTTPTMATASVRTELPPLDATARSTLHAREHSSCFACGSAAGPGLGLNFSLSDFDYDVTADWIPPAWAVSYDATVHGGLIATALDSAMVHALFARNFTGRTAELCIRYRHPVLPALPCNIRARLLGQRGPLGQLEATIHQAGRLCARATATFMTSRPAPPLTHA